MQFKSVVLALLTGLLSQAAIGQGPPTPPTEDVNVINTPDVSVINTPNVSVTNTPNVNILNEPVDVNVVNNASPVSVPTEPFQIGLSGSFVAGSPSLTEQTGFPDSNVFTVPSGKRLVIEHVSINTSIPIGQSGATITLRVTTDVGKQSLNHRFVMTKQFEITGLEDRWTASQPIKLYAGPNTDVVLAGQRSVLESTLEGAALLSISGFLVPVP